MLRKKSQRELAEDEEEFKSFIETEEKELDAKDEEAVADDKFLLDFVKERKWLDKNELPR